MSDATLEPSRTVRMMGGPTRQGATTKLKIFDQVHGGVVEGYVTGNVTPDGQLREVFLHGFGKEGSTLYGWTQTCAILLSLGLQGGTDFMLLANRVGAMKFAPYGTTNDPDIPWVPSVPAYVMAWLAMRFGDEQAKAGMRKVMDGWR